MPSFASATASKSSCCRSRSMPEHPELHIDFSVSLRFIFEYRVSSNRDQKPALSHALIEIQTQQFSRHLGLVCERNNNGAIQPKMIRPTIAPRIEKSFHASRPRRNGTNIRALPKVAAKATVRKVIPRCLSTMFPAQDVIDLMRRVGVLFMKQAVFTTKPRPIAYQRPQCIANLHRKAATGAAPRPSP